MFPSGAIWSRLRIPRCPARFWWKTREGVDHDCRRHAERLLAVGLLEVSDDFGLGVFGALGGGAENVGGVLDAHGEDVGGALDGVFGRGGARDEGGEVADVAGDEARLGESRAVGLVAPAKEGVFERRAVGEGAVDGVGAGQVSQEVGRAQRDGGGDAPGCAGGIDVERLAKPVEGFGFDGMGGRVLVLDDDGPPAAVGYNEGVGLAHGAAKGALVLAKRAPTGAHAVKERGDAPVKLVFSDGHVDGSWDLARRRKGAKARRAQRVWFGCRVGC